MKSSFIIKFLSAVNAKPPTVNTSEAKPEGEAGSVQTNAKGQRQRHLRLKKLVGKTKDKMAAIAVCLRDAGHSATGKP